ncbi:DUF6094 domain-containing protein [Alicyclobacillus tolerans]|uniref:DUF6094 domain-containing protein n=1 Tax=Alicyclobacillus tolerans TaxID=90970 RepID=UPI001F3953D6|nr:DUF6094 domain-containing protein [Alicyclobacillus tolerans]MCF8568027.1 DUF6094 domain-containing protein [Alicyclobacillus tolerans]
MRYEGVAKAGFFPTPVTQTAKILNRLRFIGPTRLFDPCCGTGEALAQVQQYAPFGSRSYGIELDKERAKAAKNQLDEVVACGYENARVDAASMPLLWLNPPYDNQAGMGSNLSRKELIFLRGLSKCVKPNGVLVFIIPRYTLSKEMVDALEHRYTNLAVYRFDDDEYPVFKQIVVFGTRRGRNLENVKQLTDAEREARNELLRVGRDMDLPVPYLDEADGKVWTVPETNVQESVLFRGYLRDESELIRDLQTSDAFQVASNMLNSALVETRLRRPLLPFRRTHLATLIASGVLNGSMGIGPDRHMVIGVSRKKVTRETLVDENGGESVIDTENYVTVVRTIQTDGTIIDLQ